jgi:uncharacterized oxidoreductase
MEFKANTVLITGGESGIGFSLAKRFVQAGSSVIICGRREHKLKEAQSKYPQLHIRVCNVADPIERVATRGIVCLGNRNIPGAEYARQQCGDSTTD